MIENRILSEVDLANAWTDRFFITIKRIDRRMSLKNQLAVGLDKGFVTAKRTSKKTRPSRRRGKQNAAIASARLVDIYKIGIGNPDKRVYKISKKRVRFRIAAFIFSSLSSTLTFLSKKQLGTHKRALKKREGIKQIYQDMRTAAAAKN